MYGWSSGAADPAKRMTHTCDAGTGMRGGGRHTDALVESVDVFPTLLEVAGLPPPPQRLEGQSFARLLEDPR